jgi:hypothetical protein
MSHHTFGWYHLNLEGYGKRARGRIAPEQAAQERKPTRGHEQRVMTPGIQLRAVEGA